LKVTATFLPTLGAQPFLGRGFATDEDQPGKSGVMILTNSYWMKRFAGDPKVIGRTLRVGIDPLTVIGVLPPTFDNTVIWFGVSYVRPETIWPSFATMRSPKWYDIIARLKPGISRRSAQAELSVFAARFAKDYPADDAVDNLRITDLGSSFADGNSKPCPRCSYRAPGCKPALLCYCSWSAFSPVTCQPAAQAASIRCLPCAQSESLTVPNRASNREDPTRASSGSGHRPDCLNREGC
jgi:hypothetical protein